MNFLRLFSLFALAALSVGCAKNHDSNSDDSLPVHATMSLEEAQNVARNAVVSCETSCNPAVGMLSMAGRFEGTWGAAQCTASLVGPDLAVTNGHCIPDDIAVAGTDCSERIWINFPDSGDQPEYERQLRCSRVLYRRRDENIHGADLAYIRLEHSSKRPPLTISRAGFADGQQYEVEKVNPVTYPDRIGGMLNRTSCRAIFDTMVYEGALDSRSLSTLLTDCLVIPGNSGSPVIAGDGSVHGVLYAFMKKDLIHDQLVQKGMQVPDTSEIADLNLASNFACLVDPSDFGGSNLPPNCAQLTTLEAQNKTLFHQHLNQNLSSRVEDLLVTNASDQPNLLAYRWALDNPAFDSAQESDLGLPTCVLPNRAASLTNQKVPVKRPEFTLQAKVNRYLEPDFQLSWGGFSSTEEDFLLSGSANLGNLSLSLLDSGDRVEKNIAVSTCR
jgi:V8-like Glu-specific endopeptidase